jgi:hypothetical protein
MVWNMNYQSEEEYNEAMSGQAQAEAEYHHRQDWEEYLNELLFAQQYTLFAIEVGIDMLNSRAFSSSGLSAIDYFIKRKNMIEDEMKPKPIENIDSKLKDTDELPF